MKVLKVFTVILILTMGSLLYVHQQVELVKLSYAIEYKEKKLEVLLDQREKLVYNLDHLTSPSSLGKILIAKNVKVEYPKREQVIIASRLKGDRLAPAIRLARAPKRGVVGGILDLIGMGGLEAHAGEDKP